MVHTNKVLTVSYGTFSCTLEGFDDSFGTMKAIAEYFRDLASDDRYFGAEPPQPDADMLARIAQREISRRVEAHTDGNAIVLRANESQRAQQTSPPPVAPQPPVTQVEPAEADAMSADVSVDNAPQSSLVPQTAEDVIETQVAPSPEPEPEVISATVSDMELDVTTQPHQPDEAPVEVAQTAPAEAEIAQEPMALDSIEPQDDMVEEFIPADEPVENDAIPAASVASLSPAVDSIAAKLQRIRDVVARDAVAATQAPIEDVLAQDHSEDITEAAAVDASADVIQQPDLSETIEQVSAQADTVEATIQAVDTAELAPVIEETIPQDTGAHPADEAALLDSIALATADPDLAVEAPLERIKEALTTPLEPSVTDAAIQAPAPQDDPGAVDNAPQETAPFDLAAFEAVADAAKQEDSDTVDGEDTIFAGLDDTSIDPVAPDEVDADIRNILATESRAPNAEMPTPDASQRPRVIKVKRSDLEAAIEQGALEEIEDAPEAEIQPGAASEVDDSSLSAEDEADLMRELAAVEAEITSPGTAQVDEDMPRLLAEAGQKMNEQESATNRETYAQLRAAVAATKAEQRVRGDTKLLSLDEEYRNDLASVVRPDRPMTRPMTRPITKSLSRGRPSADIAAPLKLVAEQRVDGSEEAPRAPVRPRRVTTEMPHEQSGGDTEDAVNAFALFADQAGATGPAELMEAAASYMCFVEGQEMFSRPQLMNKLRGIEKDNFNREDGLRAFGQLLREGKIQKTGGGRFTASEGIGFRPDQRAAG